MYKVEAVILKEGTLPVTWIRYSDKPMTLRQCRTLITPVDGRKNFTTSHPKIEITEFKCTQI